MYYDKESDSMTLSVGELCSLALKSGDLDSRYPRRAVGSPPADGGSGREQDSVTDGDYYPNVMLRHSCRVEDVTFGLSGRADGIARDGQGGYVLVAVRHIAKSSRIPHTLPELELAELCSLGYFLCASRGLFSLTLQVTYLSEDGQRTERVTPMTAEELKTVFYGLLSKVYPVAKDAYERQTLVRGKARRAVFPYREMREPQEALIRECLRYIRRGRRVFAQAPTGIGKTISTLYPAVRCFGEDRCDKVFYLTAKASTRREAVSAAERMVGAGTPVRGVVLSSREAMCACKRAKEGGGRLSRFCNPVSCPYAKGYYDKAEGVLQKLLSEGAGVFTYARIKAAAEESGVCPYELSLDLSERCELVICDYNYVFSPAIYLKRYFAEGLPNTAGHRYVFLVDEAHNLVDRAKEMYSGGLSAAGLRELQDIMQAHEDAVAAEEKTMIFPLEDGGSEAPKGGRLSAKDMDDMIGALDRMAVLCRDNVTLTAEGVRYGAELTRQLPEGIYPPACELLARCEGWLRHHENHPLYATVDNLSAMLKDFCVAAESYDRHFSTLVEVEGEDVRVSLDCLDPSSVLAPRLGFAKASVFFSATLTPVDYFADLLGGGSDAVCLSCQSPFPRENLCVVVGSGVSTRYGDREGSYRRVVSHIAAAVSAKKGNYMVFFPSYEYMEHVRESFEEIYPNVKLQVQKSHMTLEEKEAFVKAFSEQTCKLQIGFCVLGGSFSEGLDLPGEALIGVVVVGVGIPGISSRRNVVKEYYDETREGQGYAYAYTYPGMNNVLQAAGRVIRRQEDKGVVVLLDERYAAPPYPRMFPDHWGAPYLASDARVLLDILKEFWKEKQE